MKKLIYALLIGAAFLTPEKKQDVGKLLPVELVSLRRGGDMVMIETDTGALGAGENVTAAIDDLEESASGVIYLDTADHLLVSSDGWALLKELAPYLKEKVTVNICDDAADLAEAAKYLSVHKSAVTLGEALEGSEIPVLENAGERFLVKNENST